MFNTYFTMNESQAVAYAKTKLAFFEGHEVVTCAEIGDGNLNYIFRLQSEDTGRSIIIKQSGPVARISEDFKLSPDRNRIEYEILKLQHDLAPGFVPRVYHYDPIMNCTVMDDLSDHVIMRREMLALKQFPHFAEAITTFMVQTLLLTSDVCMNHKDKKEWVKRFINPELCEITEDLVYTEPFDDFNKRNDVFGPNRDWVRQELYADEALKIETAQLKFEFMNHAQALIHGDLHTGSIFIRPDSIKMIDPEFAFYGPMGYDVGNVMANLGFAWIFADAHGAMEQKQWLEKTLEDVIELFKSKFEALWEEKATERVARYSGFRERYLQGVLRDTSAVTGLELIRRTVGIAHVKDITSIADVDKRLRAERIAVSAGKHFIQRRTDILSGRDYVDAFKTMGEKF